MLGVTEIARHFVHPLTGCGDADPVAGLQDETVGREEVVVGPSHPRGPSLEGAPEIEVAHRPTEEPPLRQYDPPEIDIVPLLVQAQTRAPPELLDGVLDRQRRTDGQDAVTGPQNRVPV